MKPTQLSVVIGALILGLAALLVAPRLAGASPCITAGQPCLTKQSCCPGLLCTGTKPNKKGSGFGVCAAPTPTPTPTNTPTSTPTNTPTNTPETCLPDGTACASDSQCCSGSACGHIVGPVPNSCCVLGGSACTSTSICCGIAVCHLGTCNQP